MNLELLSLLRCPSCGGEGGFDLAVVEEDEREVVRGALRCRACGDEFSVHGGIVDLLGPCSSAATQEREVYRASRANLLERIKDMSPQRQAEELRRIAFMEHTGDHFRLSSALNLEAALAMVSPRGFDWLLDLGAGSGWLTSRWARRGFRCVAVDISQDLKLELAPLVMREEGVLFDRVLADMTNIPVRSGSVAVVFVSASLHHAEDLAKTLCEVARVLSTGGKLVAINEPMHGLLRRGGQRFLDQAAAETPGLHERSFSYLEWRAALRHAGLVPRFFFPPYYRAVLDGGIDPPASSRAFVRSARFVWRTPVRHLVTWGPCMAMAQLVLGVNVCMVATKTQR